MSMRIALVTLAALLLVAPAAAHTSVFSPDGKYRAVVGLLEEPVVTYQKTGLDLCFQANNTARAPLSAVNPGGLTATLVSPDGERLTQELRSQFGRPGCFSFQDPIVLTMPGQYTVDLEGDVNGTMVDFTGVLAGGAVKDLGIVQFPNDDPTTAELASELVAHGDAATKAELEALRARVQALESKPAAEPRDAPMPALLAVLAVLGIAVALRRRN